MMLSYKLFTIACFLFKNTQYVKQMLSITYIVLDLELEDLDSSNDPFYDFIHLGECTI